MIVTSKYYAFARSGYRNDSSRFDYVLQIVTPNCVYGLFIGAGKTGTTNKNSDGWFIGYVPKLTAGAWVGNEDRGSYLLSDGARQALPTWGLFFKKVLADKSLDILTSDAFDVPQV